MNRQKRNCAMMLLLACMFSVSMAIPIRAQDAPKSPAEAPQATVPAVTTPAPATPPKIDKGDTAWMLTSSALVLMMTIPGLFLFYGGLVRRKNVLGTIMHSFIIVAVISIQWVL